MRFKLPKDDGVYHWTHHVKGKMMQYRLSESLIKRIIRFPKRAEEGIAEATIAVMRPTAAKKQSEIWVMYKKILPSAKGKALNADGSLLKKQKYVIISTWRYPGISPIGKPIRIPDDVIEELQKWFGKS